MSISKYLEIKKTFPPMIECFYAFNEKQFVENREKAGISPDKKIYAYNGGLYGTKNGITNYLKDIDENLARIPKECNPQQVYNFEFDNHECKHSGEDTEVIKLVVSYFGEEVAKTVKRRCAYVNIDDLFIQK